MIPRAFQYFAPATLDEAINLLRTHGDEAKILAGGHSLIPLMKLRLASPGYLIDIGRIAGLSQIHEDGASISLGALTTHTAIEQSDLLKARLPLLPEAAACIGDAQVRNRGTIGGSLSHAHPAADLPAVVLALDAEMVIQSGSGRRSVGTSDFFVSMLTTVVQPDEVLVEISIPTLPARTGTAYLKVPDKASHHAVVGVAAVVRLARDGTLQSTRIGVTGLAAKAFRARVAEAALTNQPLNQQAVRAAAERVAEDAEPLSDIHASGAYRAHLARVYAARAIHLAASRALIQPGSRQIIRNS
jgi:carbon-monoxide dehydrogenase medium subunit